MKVDFFTWNVGSVIEIRIDCKYFGKEGLCDETRNKMNAKACKRAGRRIYGFSQ